MRIKPIVVNIYDLPQTVQLAGIRILASQQAIQLAEQMGLPGVFCESDGEFQWQQQIQSGGAGVQFLSPQPIPLDPLELPINLPGGKGDNVLFMADSFFDVITAYPAGIQFLDQFLQPIPGNVEVNLIQQPFEADLNVCQIRICSYADGTVLQLPYSQNIPCPPVNANGSPLIDDLVRIKPISIDIDDLPVPISPGGIRFTGSSPGTFGPPPPGLPWNHQTIGMGAGIQFLPPQPLELHPENQPRPLIDGPDNQPFFVVDLLPGDLGADPIEAILLNTDLDPFPVDVEIVTVVLGDVDMNGVVNLLDVNPFLFHISNGIFRVQADVNGDGAVNLLDVNPFILLFGSN